MVVQHLVVVQLMIVIFNALVTISSSFIPDDNNSYDIGSVISGALFMQPRLMVLSKELLIPQIN